MHMHAPEAVFAFAKIKIVLVFFCQNCRFWHGRKRFPFCPQANTGIYPRFNGWRLLFDMCMYAQRMRFSVHFLANGFDKSAVFFATDHGAEFDLRVPV